MRRSLSLKLAAAFVWTGAAFWSAPASADAIDGEWCLASRHFQIQGPTIVTPGGNKIQGNYTRHTFSYTIPANEAGAGSDAVMLLLNAENVQVRWGPGEPEVWRRCKVTS